MKKQENQDKAKNQNKKTNIPKTIGKKSFVNDKKKTKKGQKHREKTTKARNFQRTKKQKRNQKSREIEQKPENNQQKK